MSDDRYAEWDAAFAMNALDPAEEAEFVDHLLGCSPCRARVAAATGTLAALADVRPADVAAEADATSPGSTAPDILLPALLRRAHRERRRGRVVTGVLAVATAACLVALAVLVWPTHANRAPALRLRPVASAPITATAVLQPTAWGTEIHVRCRYEAAAAGYPPYELRVVDRSGAAYDAGTWRVSAGEETDFTGGAAVRRERIAKVQVTLADGTPVLQLDL